MGRKSEICELALEHSLMFGAFVLMPLSTAFSQGIFLPFIVFNGIVLHIIIISLLEWRRKKYVS
jgi:hypothetical protein